MYKVILVVHIMAALALIGIVLVQRSSSDGMGLSGSSSSSNFLSGRAAANFASRTTAILAFIFIATSLVLGIITARSHVTEGSLADRIKSAPAAASKPAAPVPSLPDVNSPAATAPKTETPAQAPVAETPKTAPSVPRPE